MYLLNFPEFKFTKLKEQEETCLPDYAELIRRVGVNPNYCKIKGLTVVDVLTSASLNGIEFVNMTGADIGVYTKTGKLIYILPMSGVVIDESNIESVEQYSYMKIIVTKEIKEKYPDRDDFVTNTKPVFDGDKIIGIYGIRALK